MLAATADGDFNAAAVCARMLDEDPRFALDALGPVEPDAPAPVDRHADTDGERGRGRGEAGATSPAREKSKKAKQTGEARGAALVPEKARGLDRGVEGTGADSARRTGTGVARCRDARSTTPADRCVGRPWSATTTVSITTTS